MRIFGRQIGRQRKEKSLSPPRGDRGWFNLIHEPFAGAWQRNISIDQDTVISQHAVFACMTLIARDIAKLRVRLLQRDQSSRIWSEVKDPSFSPVLRKPNGYQTRIQFFEQWMLSKLAHGNTYVLKARDSRNVVARMYVLDPSRVTPLISDSGEVYYRLSSDALSGLTEDSVVVPAREIIHDRMNCLFHPLVGLSPIFASGLAATHGINIQRDGAWFFGNRSMPGGVLSAPGAISQDTAERLKKHWEENYSGAKVGSVAVLGDGLQFTQMRMTAVDAQVIEQLKWSAETVCSTFHVPPYKIGVGAIPNASNIQALNLEYYQQALQSLIEDAELCLDEGLGLGEDMSTEFDLDGLLRMDSKTLIEVVEKGVGSGTWSPNEGRRKFSLPPVEGGDTPYLQQQNFSLAALAERDQNKPFAKPDSAPEAITGGDLQPPDDQVTAAGVAHYLRQELFA